MGMAEAKSWLPRLSTGGAAPGASGVKSPRSPPMLLCRECPPTAPAPPPVFSRWCVWNPQPPGVRAPEPALGEEGEGNASNGFRSRPSGVALGVSWSTADSGQNLSMRNAELNDEASCGACAAAATGAEEEITDSVLCWGESGWFGCSNNFSLVILAASGASVRRDGRCEADRAIWCGGREE